MTSKRARSPPTVRTVPVVPAETYRTGQSTPRTDGPHSGHRVVSVNASQTRSRGAAVTRETSSRRPSGVRANSITVPNGARWAWFSRQRKAGTRQKIRTAREGNGPDAWPGGVKFPGGDESGMKGNKPKMVLVAVIGAVAFVLVRRAIGGRIEEPEEAEESEEDGGIDTVSTRDADESEGIDLDETVEADDETEDADDTGTDLQVRAVEKALDSFDYLAIGAAGAKAAYQEYRERAS